MSTDTWEHQVKHHFIIIMGTLYLRAAVHRRGQRPPKGLGMWKQPSAQARTQASGASKEKEFVEDL